MRIISACSAILVVSLLASPIVAHADELQDTNETKINFEIKDGGSVNDGVMLESSDNALLAYDPNNFKNTVAASFQIDPERSAVLAQFQAEGNMGDLPQGKFVIDASAYTASADECGKSDGVTASGLRVKEKETLACPARFPFGTKIQIEGLGTYVCEDRGGAIRGDHIDIYMRTKNEAFGFGRQNLMAKVVS